MTGSVWSLVIVGVLVPVGCLPMLVRERWRRRP